MTPAARGAVSDHRTVEVGGSPVHVLDTGTGPAVLMLHGSGPGTTTPFRFKFQFHQSKNYGLSLISSARSTIRSTSIAA